MPHLANRVLVPERFNLDDALFDVPLIPYPGKPIVCMLPGDAKRGEPIIFQGREVQLEVPLDVAAKFRPDIGIIAKWKPRLDPDGDYIYPWDEQLREGMLVAVRPWSGSWYDRSAFDWIPENRWLHIYGGSDYDWTEHILCEVELT